MGPVRQQLVAALHASPTKCVLALTGGGSSAVADLLAVPGASRTVLDCIIPYHDAALAHFLALRPEQFCSADTARAMARRAFERAERLAPGEPVVGVGCTASLATGRPKRGDHRLHVGTHDDAWTVMYSLTLAKGSRDRTDEEAVASGVVLNALAAAFGIAERVELPLLPGEQLQTVDTPLPGLLAAFQRGEIPKLCQEPDGRLCSDAPLSPALLCGSFNPLHEAHRRLAEVAAARIGVPVAFELGTVNADKPPLSSAEVKLRLRQFESLAPVWLTRAPTFAAKAMLFPGTTFVVGVDTAERIVAPRFYGDSPQAMLDALAAIRAAGCRFIVAGRADAVGRFVAAEAVAVQEPFRDLFEPMPEAAFRHDLCSTQLRSGSRP